MRGFKDLLAYTKAFEVSMKIFEISRSFPKEETYSLTDQIRRSSRSVCANLAESYRKRVYFYPRLRTRKWKIPKLRFGLTLL